MPTSSSAVRLVADLVAAADRQRRWRDLAGLLVRAWPVVGGVALVIAVVGRFAAWPSLVPSVVLGIAVTAAAAGTLLARRPRAATLAAAGRGDRDAGLGGELASAYWFSTRADTGRDHDAWVWFHIERAAAHAGGIDWQKVYAPPPVWRRLATGMLLSTLALTVSFARPALGPGPSASTTLARTLATALKEADLAPASRADLEELIATLERGEFTADNVAQVSELIDLAAAGDPALRDKLHELLAKAAADAGTDLAAAHVERPLAEAAREAQPPRPEEGRRSSDEWALDERAAQEAAEAAERRGDSTARPAGGGTAADADRTAAGSPAAEARDLVSALGASQVMLGEQADDTSGAAGSSMGGRSNGVTAPAVAITLPDALAREVIEAHDEVAGSDPKTKQHLRRAEQAASGLASAGGAARLIFDRAHVLPPSPVPEARRALIEGYFARP